jgi:hypothetical protein
MMLRLGTTLLLAILVFPARADENLPAAPRVVDRVRALLPEYAPEAHAKAEAERAAVAAVDPDVEVLPEFTVVEKAMRQMREDSLYRQGAFDQELVKRELSDFDRYLLNRYTLVLRLGFFSIGIGTTKEARAREAYLARKQRERDEHIQDLADVVSVADPDEGRALRHMVRDSVYDRSDARGRGQVPTGLGQP